MKCEKCKYWKKIKEDDYYKDMGKCTKLSAPDNVEYPEVENTGIESTPLCIHDGIGTDYETKKWFGCIHFIKF